jgi:hypothetical protein
MRQLPIAAAAAIATSIWLLSSRGRRCGKVGSALRLQPVLAVAILGHAVSGFRAGYFSGWIAALWRGYRDF